MTFKTLTDLLQEEASGKTPLENRRVLLRADYNVPRQGEEVRDTARLEATLPTLVPLLERGAKVIVLSHLGRPKGKPDLSLSLAFLPPLLSGLLNQKVFFYDDSQEKSLECFIEESPPGSLILLENLRFNPGEESNDQEFARALSSLGDLYINDAFSASHRDHASIVSLPSFLSSYAGALFEKEHALVQQIMASPKRPLMAIVAGSKVSTKLALLESLLGVVDKLVLGGGIANTFLAAQGYSMGQSLVEESMLETARRILEKADKMNSDIILPCDFVGAIELGETPRVYRPTLSSKDSSSQDQLNLRALDIGPETIKTIEDALQTVKTVLWNGPLGVFESPPFDAGTVQVAKAVGRLTQEGKLISIAGGGDTAAAMAHANVTNYLSGLSLSGGAFLEALEGKALPGVVALETSVRKEQRDNKAC